MKVFFDQDNNCHWYIVQANKRKEWEAWLELGSRNPESWKIPNFAERINGHPHQVEVDIDIELRSWSTLSKEARDKWMDENKY